MLLETEYVKESLKFCAVVNAVCEYTKDWLYQCLLVAGVLTTLKWSLNVVILVPCAFWLVLLSTHTIKPLLLVFFLTIPLL